MFKVRVKVRFRNLVKGSIRFGIQLRLGNIVRVSFTVRDMDKVRF